jgi:hypothetical protein
MEREVDGSRLLHAEVPPNGRMKVKPRLKFCPEKNSKKQFRTRTRHPSFSLSHSLGSKLALAED